MGKALSDELSCPCDRSCFFWANFPETTLCNIDRFFNALPCLVAAISLIMTLAVRSFFLKLNLDVLGLDLNQLFLFLCYVQGYTNYSWSCSPSFSF